MEGKKLNKRAIIAVIAVMTVASLVYFSTMKSPKDPATIALNLGDMPPGTSVVGEKYVPLSDMEKLEPNLPWRQWGYEIGYYITFSDNREVLCEVFRFSSPEGARSALESMHLSLELQEVRRVSIGDEGRLYRGIRFPNSCYVAFRKANFIALLGVKPASEERVLEYSRIVESKMES